MRSKARERFRKPLLLRERKQERSEEDQEDKQIYY
nr:MAG TPA: hypothetical protein [Caudoviricetes sp.]